MFYLASPAGLVLRSFKENGETGAERHSVTEATASGHALENGSEPKDSKSDLSGGKKDFADRCECRSKPNRTQGKSRQMEVFCPLVSFIGETHEYRRSLQGQRRLLQNDPLLREIGLSVPPFERVQAIGLTATTTSIRFASCAGARDLGFSVEQIKELLALWRDRSRASSDVKAVALEHIAELERKIAAIQEMTRTLKHLAGHCSRRRSAGLPDHRRNRERVPPG